MADPRAGRWIVETPRRYRMQSNGRGKVVLWHRVRAERALGRPLPQGAQVHHADGTKGDHAQLVICQDAAYHKLLHRRMRIKAAGGNPNTDWVCSSCRCAKPRDQFFSNRSTASGLTNLCRHCTRAYETKRKAAHHV